MINFHFRLLKYLGGLFIRAAVKVHPQLTRRTDSGTTVGCACVMRGRMRTALLEPAGYKTIWGAETSVNTRNKTAVIVTSASGVSDTSTLCSHVNKLNNRVCWLLSVYLSCSYGCSLLTLTVGLTAGVLSVNKLNILICNCHEANSVLTSA
jgi:hypothetical protein